MPQTSAMVTTAVTATEIAPRPQASWVRGRADNYRTILDQLWDKVAPRLLKAETRQDVVKSFGAEITGGYAFEFISLADLILQVLHEQKFPKETLNKLARLRGRKGSAMPIRTFGSLFALPPASGGSLVI